MARAILALEEFNKYFLSVAAALLLLAAGLYFTIRFKAFYLRHPILTLRAMPLENGASQMLLSLGGTVGVGNISGVALAIMYGGAGSVFWMWAGALFAMALKYAEIILGMVSRRCRDGKHYGGAPYYIKDIFGRLPAAAFAILLVFDSTVMGGIIQSSAIAEAAEVGFGISPLVTGIFTAMCAATVFFFKVNVFRLSVWLVPTMSIGYVLAALFLIAVRAEQIPEMLCSIFVKAFQPSAAAGGVLGILMSPSLRQGIVKGLFSNEAGCGTATISHASSDEKIPARQGLFGIFEVFCDTLLICSLTAFAILLTLGDGILSIGGGGVRVCVNAFSGIFGAAGGSVLCVFVFMFAFATVVSFGYYGVQSLAYFKRGALGEKPFLIVYCLSLFIGAIAAPSAAWAVSDGVICLMLLINTAAVLAESKKIVGAHNSFYSQMGKYSHKARRTRSRSHSAIKNEMPISDREI